MALVITTASAARKPYIHLCRSGGLEIFARHPKRGGEHQSFEKKIGWGGKLGGLIWLVKATVFLVVAIYIPPYLNYIPNYLQSVVVWAPIVGRHG